MINNNGCEHFTIRDFVSEVRERDWRLTFPLPDMTPEQIKALLPPMESSKFKRWNCARCVAGFFQGDHCAVHHQLIMNGAAGGGLPSNDDQHVTRKDNFMADKINVDITLVPADDDNNTTDSDLLMNTSEKPKALLLLLLFDLNETPTPEDDDSDEILENELAAATEEFAMDNNMTAKCHDIANLAPVVVDIGNTNEPDQIRSIEAFDSIDQVDDDIIPQTIRRSRPAVKYRALSELSDQDIKREEGQNIIDSNGTDHETMVPTPDDPVQPIKKKIKLNKKKKKKSQHYSRPEGCSRAAHEKRRTFDFNFLQQAGASLQSSPAAPCAKRKNHQVSPDQNENSDTLVSGSSEIGIMAGTQKEIGKKRRIFGDKLVLKTSKDADQSSQVESGAIQRKIHKHRASLERVKHNLNAVVEHGNSSLPTQREEAASELEADQQRSGAKQKKMNSSVSSGSASEKRLTVVGKELPNSTIEKDVTIAAPQNETVNKLLPKNKRVFVDQALKEHGEADELCQLKSGIKIHNRPVSVQRVKLDSSSAIEKQNLNPMVSENEKESSKQTKRPAGKDTKGMLGAQPQKKNCSEKFNGKDVNQHMIVAQQHKKNESDIRSSASKKRGPPIVVRESPPALTNTPTVSPIHSREKALNGIHLLSIVATEHEELRATEDIYALSADKVPPSKSDIPALGYDGCVQVTVPTDYLLIDEEGDPFKLGPEDLPLRSHRLLIGFKESGDQMT